jgi:hypothetical protein
MKVSSNVFQFDSVHLTDDDIYQHLFVRPQQRVIKHIANCKACAEKVKLVTVSTYTSSVPDGYNGPGGATA